MRFFNWAKAFEEKPTCEDILKSVKKTEIIYWMFEVVFVVITIIGVSIFTAASQEDIKQHILGLFISIVGIVNITVIKMWAYVYTSMLYMIWDSQNRLKAELAKMESADL
ncbi:MAG: hypothetical protein K8R02_02520 [Anaerohalosphaeraceae bacterium]|nr:hypothetical protein [Anaerohalosphaeraceae bacterium]